MAAPDARAWKVGASIEEWIALTGWIALFLLGPAVPQLLERLRVVDELQVLYEGPILFADRAAYSLEIYNAGRLPKHDVEVRVPLPKAGEVLLEGNPYEISSPLRPSVRDADGYRIFGMGDLQPGGHLALSVAVRWTPSGDPERRYADIPWIMAQVVSAEKRAQPTAWRFRAYRSEASERWYKSAFNLMSAAVVLLLIVLSRSSAQPQEPPKPTPAPKEAWRRPAQRPVGTY